MSAEAKADLFCDVALASEVAYHQNSEAHDSLIELLSETITRTYILNSRWLLNICCCRWRC